MRILYHQAEDIPCMHSYEIKRGFLELGHEVFSNLVNQEGVQPEDGGIYDITVVSTSGARDNNFVPLGKYIYVDGRDTADRSPLHNGATVFKANGNREGALRLPACVDPAWLTPPSKKRKTQLSFLSGHGEHGRDEVMQWVKLRGGLVGSVDDVDIKPVNPKHSAVHCNVFSPKYYAALKDTVASINAPGGGVMTKRFFEIIASGCVCLNYVPLDYYQSTNNILDALPDDIGFPREAVLNFSTKLEFADCLKRVSPDLARETYKWAKRWTYKEKAQYILKYA